MYQLIARSDHFKPGQSWITSLDIIRHAISCFTDYLHQPGQGEVQQAILLKIHKRFTTAYVHRFFGMIHYLVEGYNRITFAHKP
jgi:hypothetical protein